MINIKYHKDILIYLDELIDILIDAGYFSFYAASVQYIEDLVSYIEKNIVIQPYKFAPAHFSKYGDNLLYITYKRNRQTIWYVFFQKFDSSYFIRYITNNHVSAKYF
jgi:hypothetical protein